MARCVSCDAPVLWALSASSGARIPLNPEPTPDGNLLAVRSDGRPLDHAAALASVETGRTRMASLAAVTRSGHPTVGPRWAAHFATCPNAAEHRKARTR